MPHPQLHRNGITASPVPYTSAHLLPHLGSHLNPTETTRPRAPLPLLSRRVRSIAVDTAAHRPPGPHATNYLRPLSVTSYRPPRIPAYHSGPSGATSSLEQLRNQRFANRSARPCDKNAHRPFLSTATKPTLRLSSGDFASTHRAFPIEMPPFLSSASR